MIDAAALSTVAESFRPLLLTGDRNAIQNAKSAWGESGFTVRLVRGAKMRTSPGLLDEFAAALQFPLYFGENKDAFDECIGDLDSFLPAGAGYVVVVTDPDEVLAAEVSSLDWFVTSLASAAAELGRPVELGEWWDRPSIAFHVVLAGDEDALERAQGLWAR